MSNRYLDWIPILDYIDNKQQLTILELGCGQGTSILTNQFKFVYSYETNSRDIDGKWFDLTLEHNKSKQWQGYFDNQFPSIFINVNSLMKKIINTVNINDIDVVFVDPGFANRAECVLEFMKLNVPYIFTHDTETQPELYNWGLLKHIPNTYTLHASITSGQGTRLWKLNI
jgi:hypothetical protein